MAERMLKRAYIERGEAFGAVQEHFQNGGFKSYADGQACLERIKDIPAADVAPVSHGRWIERDLDNFRKYECACSECGARYIGNYDQYCEPTDFSFCPNCGAKMDEEVKI